MSDSPSVPPQLREAIETLIDDALWGARNGEPERDTGGAVCAVIEAHLEQRGWSCVNEDRHGVEDPEDPKGHGQNMIRGLFMDQRCEQAVAVFRWRSEPKDASDV